MEDLQCKYSSVEHHPNVNNLQIDPEKVRSMAPKAGSYSLFNILRVNPLDPRKRRHIGQHIYFIVYMMFYGLLNYIFSISITFPSVSYDTKYNLMVLCATDYAITGQGTVKLSKKLWRYRITGLLVNFFMFFRFIILPYHQTGSFLTVLSVSCCTFKIN